MSLLQSRMQESRCKCCNNKITVSNMVKIDKEIRNNTHIISYTCSSCIDFMNANEKLAKKEDKVKLLITKIDEADLKIKKHVNTLKRLQAENESILDEIQKVRTERDYQKNILACINFEMDALKISVNEARSDKADNDAKCMINVTCTICETEKISQLIVDCGHMMCSGCMAKVKDDCPFCRKPKPLNGFQIAKLYFN